MTDHVKVLIIVYTQEVTSVLNPGTLKCVMRCRLASAFDCNRRK